MESKLDSEEATTSAQSLYRLSYVGLLIGGVSILLSFGTIAIIRSECDLINRELNAEINNFDILAVEIWTQIRSFNVDNQKLREKRQTYGGYGGYSSSYTSNYGIYQQPSVPFRPKQARPTPPPVENFPRETSPPTWTSATKSPEGQPGIPPTFKFPPAPPATPEEPKGPQCRKL